MSLLHDRILALWNLRRDPRRGVRFLWWLCVVGLLIALAVPERWPILACIWIIVSVFRGLLSSAWGLLNIRTVLFGHRVALRWSFWLAMVASLAFYAGMQEQGEVSHPWPPSVLVLLTCALFPGLFAAFLWFSLYGAAQGASVFRDKPDLKEAVPLSVTAWWFSVLGALGLIQLLHLSRHQLLLSTCIIVGVNHYTAWLTVWMRWKGYEPQELVPRLVNGILGRLDLRWKYRGTVRRFDMRGITLGLFAAALALIIGNQVLLATQESALASLMRIRHQVYEALIQGTQTPMPPSGPVVLLRMDAASRAAVLTGRSESAMQAEVIRKLHKLGVAQIVLPYPTLQLHQEDAGATTEEAVARTRHDLSQLTQAMREAGNVILVLDQDNHTGPEARQLISAAHDIASVGLEMYGPAQLPSIPLSWQQTPPTPLVLMALANGQRLQPEARGDTLYVHSIAGIRLPQSLPGRMLVDFRSDMQGLPLFNEAIATMAYTPLLTDKPVMEQKLFGTTKAVPQAEYFQGKTAFLEPLIQAQVETPIGAMPRFEALARVTNTLLAGYALERTSPAWTFFLTLGMGALVGHLCARRDPLEAGWRVILLLLGVFAYTLVAFFVGLWVDPVVPIVTVVGAFLLITRLTFTLERDARDRNRRLLQRFLAPQIAEQLLDAPESALGLGGDKRRVVVLFADVRNFTGFAESHAPEEVIEVVNQYMTVLTDALDTYGGILDKYTGDGLMAFFLIDRNPEMEIERAVMAALAMRDAALLLSNRRKAEGRPTLNIGFGMHFGEAVVGLVGNRNRQINYTALGHTVVVSARLQTLAEGGEVVISETMHDMIRDQFHVVSHSPVQVKGISAPMRPYFVLDPVEKT